MARLLSEAKRREALIGLGWPLDRGHHAKDPASLFWATVAFQEAAGIKVDGIWGPQTQLSVYFVGLRGGRVTEHFAAREFACKCWTRGLHGEEFCHGWVTVKRPLLLKLEALRAAARRPVGIQSGYRCSAYNTWLYRQNGQRATTQSRHIHGDGCDPVMGLTLKKVRGLKLFTGLGWQGGSGIVTHVDLRPGSTAAPTTWKYA